MKNDICISINHNKPNSVDVLEGRYKLLLRGNIYTAVLGNVYSEKGKRINAEDIYALYTRYGKDVNTYLDGTYTVIIIDFNTQKSYVFQDLFGFNQSLYYYSDGERLLISNKLKSIIVNCKNNWKLNRKAAEAFLVRGYCPGKQTLIDGIFKLDGRHFLEIDLKKYTVSRKKTPKGENPKKKITPEIYDSVVEAACVTSAHERLAITVSSGYDSNYILHNLRKNFENEITAFCIGGAIGRNEIPDAIKICEGYDGVTLHTKLVDGTSLDKFPEIVYALEGAIYESGVFLQYELARLVSSHGCENIILGECADQVLNFEMYHPWGQLKNHLKYTFERLPGRIFKKIYFKPYKRVYDMASYIVIKKNGIMMNYFGVSPEYPYMRKAFYRTAENAVAVGERKKEYHKMVIDGVLPEFVKTVLKKIGGATELKTLFIGDVTLEDIKNVCENSRFYVPKEFDDKFYAIDYLMKIIYLELFEKMFIISPEKYLADSFGGYGLEHFFPEI
ncbi:MAG: hypothetical protein IKL41_02825 [Clostridia bacterium]|nr:hypothetical protein [Clostridia bacterium]